MKSSTLDRPASLDRPTTIVRSTSLGRTTTVTRGTSLDRAISCFKPRPTDFEDLYDFQRSGVRWLQVRRFALLCDEMGIGKTAQALRALRAGAIVVCPAMLRYVWRDETRKWRPDMTPVLVDDVRRPAPTELLILSYDALPEERPGAGRLCPDVSLAETQLILDEAHFCKSFRARYGEQKRGRRELEYDGAQRAIRSHLLANQVGGCWALTGTPILGDGSELWGLLSVLGLQWKVFGSWDRFLECFNAKKEKIYRKDPDSNRAKAREVTKLGVAKPEVRGLLEPYMLARKKRDVLPELPQKTFANLTVAAPAELVAELDGIMHTYGLEHPPFEALSAVRAELARSRIPAAIEYVKNAMLHGPIVVFSKHKDPIIEIGKLEGAAAVTGPPGPSFPERDRLIAKFQAGELKCLALTIDAGGVGITLTRGHHVLFVDLSYTPAENDQAEDRLARIGQQDNVLVVRMVSPHPLDLRVLEILTEKRELIESVMG